MCIRRFLSSINDPMKIDLNIPVFLSLLFLVLLSSCHAENDEYGPAIPKENQINYFPLSIGNYWEYEREEQIINHYYKSNAEKLTITDSIQEFDTPGYLFSADEISEKQGIATQLLTGGTLNKVEGKLVFNGDFTYYFPMLEDSLIIPLENALILHQNRDEGYVLSVSEGQIFQKLAIEEMEIPVVYNYHLQFIQGKSSVDHPTIDNDYEEVISSKLILKLSATAIDESQEVVRILPEQEVLVTDFSFAKDVGIFQTYSDIYLEFNHLTEFSIPEQPIYTGWNAQELKDFNLK